MIVGHVDSATVRRCSLASPSCAPAISSRSAHRRQRHSLRRDRHVRGGQGCLPDGGRLRPPAGPTLRLVTCTGAFDRASATTCRISSCTGPRMTGAAPDHARPGLPPRNDATDDVAQPLARIDIGMVGPCVRSPALRAGQPAGCRPSRRSPSWRARTWHRRGTDLGGAARARAAASRAPVVGGPQHAGARRHGPLQGVPGAGCRRFGGGRRPHGHRRAPRSAGSGASRRRPGMASSSPSSTQRMAPVGDGPSLPCSTASTTRGRTPCRRATSSMPAGWRRGRRCRGFSGHPQPRATMRRRGRRRSRRSCSGPAPPGASQSGDRGPRPRARRRWWESAGRSARARWRRATRGRCPVRRGGS